MDHGESMVTVSATGGERVVGTFTRTTAGGTPSANGPLRCWARLDMALDTKNGHAHSLTLSLFAAGFGSCSLLV